MTLNKVRYAIEGYKTPRPFSTDSIGTCLKYDTGVVDNWIRKLNKLTDSKNAMTGKSILELGPGADLGIGLILLASGAKKYSAVDVNPLAKSLPFEFYSKFFEYIKETISGADTDFLKNQLELYYKNSPDLLDYLVESDFSLSKLKLENIDLIVSQAAFEHFDDVEQTISEASKLVASGGHFFAVIDFQTHTRFLREKDPLNIYRYSEPIYNLLKFRGSPNRVRPEQYISLLRKYGWDKVIFEADKLESDHCTRSVRTFLNKGFRDDKYLSTLSGTLYATKR